VLTMVSEHAVPDSVPSAAPEGFGAALK